MLSQSVKTEIIANWYGSKDERHSFQLKPGEKKRIKEALAQKRTRKRIRKEVG